MHVGPWGTRQLLNPRKAACPDGASGWKTASWYDGLWRASTEHLRRTAPPSAWLLFLMRAQWRYPPGVRRHSGRKRIRAGEPQTLPSPTDLGITAKTNAFCFVGVFSSKVFARKDVGEAHVFTSAKYSLPASETSLFLALCCVLLVRSNDSRHDERVLQRGHLLDLQMCTG